MSKKSGTNAVDDLRQDIRGTRGDLGDTVTTLREKTGVSASTGRKAAGWGGAFLGVLAGAAAIGAMRRRKARQAPKSRAQRGSRGGGRPARKTAARAAPCARPTRGA